MAKLKSGTTIGGSTAWHAGNDGSGSGLDADLLDGLNSAQFLRSDADGTITGGLTISGSVDSGGTDFGFYQSVGTNLILKGDSNGRSGIFFESEKNGTNINDPSDYGFIQFHSYGYGGTSGESIDMVIGTANDSADRLILQTPYNQGVKIGYKDATSGTGLTLQTVFHDAYHPNADKWTTARTLSLSGDASGSVSWDGSANATLSVAVANDSHTHDGRYFTETESDSRYWRKNETGTGADFGPWYSTNAYVYDSTNGTRYFWILLGTIAASVCKGSIEYEFKDDENYPNFVKGTIAFGGWNSSSFSVQHDQHTQDPHGVQVRLDTSRRIWIRADGVDWGHYFRFRVHNQSGNFTTNTSWSTGSTRYDTLSNSVPPNSSNDILSGQNLRATSSSVTGTVPSYNNFNYFGRVYARDLMQVNGNLVWHAGNDGANSGLDADLLDGQEGSYYLNYNNLTNTPSASANYYLNGISKSGNTLTFSVNGATNQTYTFGSNAFNSTTIPTNYITNNADDTMAGNLTIDKGTSTTLSVKCDDGGNALVRAGGDGQGTGIFEVTQDNGSHGGGMSYNGDGSPTWASGETADNVTFYRIDSGTRTEVFHYPYSSNTVNFNDVPTVGGSLMMTAANIGSYAASWKYAFASNNGTNNGGNVTASSAQDGIYFNGTNGITTSASGTTLTLSGANLLRSDVSDNYAGRTLSFGVPGQGTTTTACFASIEGNTDGSGEGSGRLFFREHNSTTGSMDAYGMSLGYRGGATSVTTAGGNTWTGLSQIGNGEWGMWGHNGDNTGNLIMHGPRDGSYLEVDGNLEVNNGATTTLSVRGSGTGQAKIWARCSSQGTGMVMVSQDDDYGGGIEYNGDNNPSTTGAGADYITLFRVSGGTYSWTARNNYANNDWEFRGNVTAYASDERLKENIEPIHNAVEKVKQLRGVTFDWKDDCEDKGFMPTMKHETGVIAQDVQKVIPDAAVPAPFDEDYLTVKHEKIIPVLIEAVKEQQEQIEELKSIINTLVESK